MNQASRTPNKSLANPLSNKKTRINISRKGSIIKERCNQLMEVAWSLGYQKQILDEDLTDLIKMYIGGNRDTRRDYMGYDGKVVHGRNGSHVIGIKREGYLQLFGYAKRLNWHIWILNHKLVPLRYHTTENLSLPEGAKGNNTYDEYMQLNMEEISLSHHHLGLGENCMDASLKGSPERARQDDETVVNNNNNNTTARERNVSHSPELTTEAEALLKAVPLSSEPDRTKPNLRECSQ